MNEIMYEGPNTDRSLKQIYEGSGYRINILNECYEIISSKPKNSEFNIIDIGSGNNLRAIRDIHHDPMLNLIARQKNIHINTFTINAEKHIFTPKVPNNTIITQYIRASNSLDNIGEEGNFDLIYASWFLPYLGPTTFERTLRDSVNLLKDGGVFLAYPYASNFYSLHTAERWYSHCTKMIYSEKDLISIEGYLIKTANNLGVDEEYFRNLRNSKDADKRLRLIKERFSKYINEDYTNIIRFKKEKVLEKISCESSGLTLDFDRNYIKIKKHGNNNFI